MKHLLSILIVGCSLTAIAQTTPTRSEVRAGNRAYNHQQYDKAETHYRKAAKQDSNYYKAQYNLANALYRKKEYAEAAKHYDQALQSPTLGDRQRSQALHNQGNSHLQMGLQDKQNGMQAFGKAVDCYKQALTLDPKNEDTRYNLSYAKKLLQQAQQQQQQNQQQNQEQQQNQDKQQEQQQNKDQQDQQQQNQQNKQQNQQGEKDQDQQGEREQKQQDQKKQDAERLLEAVRNNERETMKEQQKKNVAVKGVRIEKDW